MEIEDVPATFASDVTNAPRGSAVVVSRTRVGSADAAECCGDQCDCGAANSPAADQPSAARISGQSLQAKVFVHTFGCGHNVSDGEYMAGQLAQAGYLVTDEFAGADCYVINSCTVKNPSEDHFVTMLTKARATGCPVVVAGCVPQGDPNNDQWSDVSVVGVRNIDKIDYVVNEALQGNTVRLLKPDGPRGRAMPSLSLPKVRRNRLIEIIPINVGCLNFCTYCKTKHARGDLKSWPIDEIVARVRAVIADGVVEIRMTSEDTGAYGIDIGTNIVELLRAVVKVLEGTHVMLRLGMSNPPYLLRHVGDMTAILKHPNVYEFVHIPVQSGSNAVLDVMQREYTVEEFLTCVTTLSREVPNMTVATDIICAFPGEGDAEWNSTMRLCRDLQFAVLNISRFYPRRDTPAAAMKQIPTNIAKARTAEITTFFNTYSTNNWMVGTEHDVWVTEVAHDKHHLVAHSKNFTQLLIDPSTASLGQRVRVRVTSASKYSAMASVVQPETSDDAASKASVNVVQHRVDSAGDVTMQRVSMGVAIFCVAAVTAAVLLKRTSAGR